MRFWNQVGSNLSMFQTAVHSVILNSGVEHEVSLLWVPVQNQILHFRGPKYASRLHHTASLAQAYKENTLDIGLDTLPIFVFVFP